MEGKEPLPDHLRCKRTDGRQWRCNRRVMDDKKLCEIHHLQGQHRQNRRKVPESLKLLKRSRKSAAGNLDSPSLRRNGEIRAPKQVKLKLGAKSMKRKKRKKPSSSKKRAELELELIKMVLKREVEKRKSKKKKNKQQSPEEEAVAEEMDEGESNSSDDDDGSGNSEVEGEEVMRDLPNGLMAISPAKHFGNAIGNGASCSNSSPSDIKIGSTDFSALTRRCFRSKNLEPLPIGSLQVLPYKRDATRLRRAKRRRCHWCRKGGWRTLIRCSSCRKEFFCLDCIKEQYFSTEEEIRTSCPVCRGTCACKLCSAIQCRDIESKGFSNEKSQVDKVLHFHYLICLLLPILKQINQDQSVEVEIEAKLKGKKPTDIQILQAEVGCNRQCSCNNCKTSILDFHRSCPNCSYNLCLCCCWDVFQGCLSGSAKALICKCPSRRKGCTSCKQLSEMKSLFSSMRRYGSKSLDSSILFSGLRALEGSSGIPCPPLAFGGCGDSLLHLSSVFPLSWMKELETNAEEIVGCYELPETLDIFAHCSLCVGMDHETNGIKQLQEAARREDSNDNLLYYPTIVDVHSDNLEHFQKHWGRGQPVIVRDVLQSTSDLSWDPIVMFCTYLKNNAAKSENEQADSLDWFEVEIGVRQLFMGSFRGTARDNTCHEKLKLKGWLSSFLFQEHFPAHYAEILHTLPLPEYMDPKSGVLNIAADLPKEILKPDLGPCVYISYGSGESLIQADSVTKLRYDSYDMVNILAHASDVPISTEQLNYIRKLMKTHKEENDTCEEAISDGDKINKVGMQHMVVKETQVHKKVARVSWFTAAVDEAHALSPKDDMFHDEEHGSDSDSDTDTDTEVSKFFFGPLKSTRISENYEFCGKDSGRKRFQESCGAQWDVFRRQDVPKLVEYLRKHASEFSNPYGFQKHVVHPILDQNIFLDTTHKLRLKEEYEIEPWSFEQHVGEAVIIPAGCPYQIRNLKSCVNVVLDFVSPENVTECIQLIDELRLLPENHKAKADSLEVKKMALYSINRAIKEIRELTCTEHNGEHND